MKTWFMFITLIKLKGDDDDDRNHDQFMCFIIFLKSFLLKVKLKWMAFHFNFKPHFYCYYTWLLTHSVTRFNLSYRIHWFTSSSFHQVYLEIFNVYLCSLKASVLKRVDSLIGLKFACLHFHFEREYFNVNVNFDLLINQATILHLINTTAIIQ